MAAKKKIAKKKSKKTSNNFNTSRVRARMAETKDKLIEALVSTLGIVTTACKTLNINRATFYEYYNSDKAFAKRVDDIEDIALDFSESKLHGQIGKGDTQAIMFHLKMRGRKRGYLEKTEHEHSGQITQINITRNIIQKK